MKLKVPCKLVLSVMLVSAIAVTGLPSGRAAAQNPEINSLASKLDRLERDIRAINRRLYQGGKIPRPAEARPVAPPVRATPRRQQAYIVRLEQLESDLRNTTGTIEKMAHDISEMSSRLDKLVSDMEFRLSTLEQRMGGGQPGARPRSGAGQPRARAPQLFAAGRPGAVERVGPATGAPVFGSRPAGNLGVITQDDLKNINPNAAPGSQASAITGRASGKPPPPAPPVRRSVLPKGTPKERYQFAFSLLRKAEYVKASAAFQEFIEVHPKSRLIGNAHYWLGKTYFVRKNYRTAAAVFLKAYQTSKKGPKAPDTLLHLGLSLFNLNKKGDACATYDKLADDFPNASTSIKKRLVKERKLASCG